MSGPGEGRIDGAKMLWRVVAGVLAAGLAGSLYWSYELYEANRWQTERIRALQQHADEAELRQEELVSEVQAALSQAAGAWLREAGQVEGRVSDLEAQVEDMQGLGWSSFDRSLYDLSTEVDDIWGRLGTTEQGLVNLQVRVGSLESCVSSIGDVLQGWRDYFFC